MEKNGFVRKAVCRSGALAAAFMLVGAIVAPSGAEGQVGSVSGRITDEEGAPLAGANVALVEARRGAVSRTNGDYAVDSVAAGSYTIEARLIGYRAQRQLIAVNAGERTTLDFKLKADPLKLEGVVVTGTQTPRIKLQASQAVSILTAKDLTQASPRSTTEILRYVPGFTRVESSGGEVNENISMRGILGVEYVMFMEDGLPVFPTMHTFFMNADNLFRVDENVERVEVVRGGSSALFGSNTPGAIVNFINKTGGAEIAGELKATAGTEGLARNDLNFGGPLGDRWRFNLGGFYRYDHGIRDPGYPGIRGGQFKGSVTRLLDSGYLRLSTKLIDDHNQFILPLPFVDPGHPRYVSGFSDYGAMNTNEGLDVRVPIPTGELELPLDDGLRTKGSWLTADLGLDFAQGWKLQNGAQLMQDEQGWNAILPFDVMPAGAFAQQELIRLARAGLIDSTTASYRLYYTNHFTDFGGHAAFDTPNGLVSTGGEWHVEKPLTAFQDQLQIKKAADFGTLALGLYFANYTQTNRWFFTDILTDVRDNPRFVDLVITDGTKTIDVTKNGFRNFLSNYVNGTGQSTIVSGVLGSELKLHDRLRADVGARWEYDDFVQTSENTTTIDLDGNPNTPYDRETWGDGTFRHFSRNLDDWAASVGLNYKVTDQLALYALGSRAYKMPALDEFLVAGAQQAVELFEPRRTRMVEGGVKYFPERFGFTVNGFYGVLKNIVGQGAVVDTTTGRITWVIRTSPENVSYGAEIELSARVVKGLSLLGNATLLKAELGKGAGADIGSWINGVPALIGNLAATYSTARVGLLADLHYVGKRYSDFATGTRLPWYAYSNFGASYRFPGAGLSAAVDLLNAFQSRGLEEGNPRLTGARPVFLARPILPRRVTASVRLDF